ncbi:hypothetical protein TTHERM_00535950 (macronuclear) [Tetrahymena thermophila SB210]|uniref:Uncharacterized protein n=1 Tax=Tetrahymena thermophila (strain SB210) TaxID=312017 RepID=I7MHT7_TETTS|nr:hypothetical protein TTHERM_00535950 [Tetrahymena thermophila SB210]EAS03259.1 hypothetical protein TTHERM_00535950 [Tetrahymena thermophila SB210]|eukprot:XP_001023504.1 hypothetical protein TTHERM_00535950 [Tetrahymena thermophila SB210]
MTDQEDNKSGFIKREMLKKMQITLNNYQTYIMEALKQAYSTKFMECSQKGKSQVESTKCQDILNQRLEQSFKFISQGDQPVMREFKECVKQSKKEEEMNICFNQMMQAKDDNLEKARNLLLS